tara:strand:+ start:24275 stop:25291 length:1017 start_codon:yes stop_codon:yes gene_type:complete
MNDYFQTFEFHDTSFRKVLKCKPYINDFSQYPYLLKYKFTIKDFRDINTRLCLPRCRETKREKIQHYLTNMMYLSFHVRKIQKIWRNHFICVYNETLGPSYRNFSISNNVDDFLTTEKIKDIHYYYFFSFRDRDNFVYTFHLVSIASLIEKNIRKNPYNRNDFDEDIITKVQRRIYMNKILKQTQEFQEYFNSPTTIQDRVNQIFHHFDQIGHYMTSSSWFMQLSIHQLRRFIYELYEIWNYRAELNTETRELICPPRGNPFTHLPRNFIANYNNPRLLYSSTLMRNIALTIMENLSYSAHNDENKNLGILFILSALTLVSTQTRDALPWLYASVQYN